MSTNDDTIVRENLASRLEQLRRDGAVAAVARALGEDAKLHIVGGALRDLISGRTHTDLDLATCLPPEHCRSLLEGQGLRTIATGIAHGTLTVLVEERHIELTTFRKPGPREGSAYSDSIEEDLSGRDFTINALAYDLARGALLDPFGGQADLHAAVVRAVGDPAERFREDPQRILRMVRFGPADGRSVDPKTADAAAASANLLGLVSVERIRTELVNILMSRFPRQAFEMLAEIGILAHVIPEMLPAIGCEQNEFHLHDVFQHTLRVMEHTPTEGCLRLVALFHDLGKPHTASQGEDGRRHFYRHEEVSTEIAKQVMRRLRFSNDETKKTALLVQHHMRPLTCGAPGVRRLMRDLDQSIDEWLRFKIADAPPAMSKETFREQYEHFVELLNAEQRRRALPEHGKLAVNGDDLIALGMKPGRRLGNILRDLEELVIEDPERNDRAYLLNKARDLMVEDDPQL